MVLVVVVTAYIVVFNPQNARPADRCPSDDYRRYERAGRRQRGRSGQNRFLLVRPLRARQREARPGGPAHPLRPRVDCPHGPLPRSASGQPDPAAGWQQPGLPELPPAGWPEGFFGPLCGFWGIYPTYKGRENAISTLEDRIKGCMTRSLNGRPLPLDGKEMKAIVTYMK